MSHAEPAPRRSTSDWLFDRIPLSPALFGALVAGVLIAVLALLGEVTGAFEHFAEQGVSWWQHRDGRVCVLLALLAGTIPAALRYHELGTRRNLDALAAANLWPGGAPAALREAGRRHPRAEIAFGLTGFLLVPLVALTVDRDPGLYFTAGYWGLAQLWMWIVGAFVTFTGGILTCRVFSDARAFARLARALPRVDLLETDALLPFARQGLRSAVPGVIFMTFLLLNLGDAGFVLSSVLFGLIVLVQNAATLLIPMRGAHERLRAAKREEIARVNAAIRGEPGALRGSPLGERDRPALADLLAWRAFVASVPEWPVDLSTMSRFTLYVVVPLLSWVASGLVQHVLELVIG